ncbi:hypothetical protein EC957_000511 [Mortierella hygrophila]|uniref:Uncharacterized protein n=1 Tax=Mortierella hygrophila TaxID=979708 RepID=A0A9P6K2V8_9FUNG|nr:hypothetical protein EC957_000511 [Mortierella hygrophila]
MVVAFGMRFDGFVDLEAADAADRTLLIQRGAVDESLVLEGDEPVGEVDLDGSKGVLRGS